MPNVAVPEIQRTSLLTTVLSLKSLPLPVDVLAFDFLDAPTVSHISRLQTPAGIADLTSRCAGWGYSRNWLIKVPMANS